VVDNQSSDKTCAIAEKFADVVLEKGPERSAQRNYGAKHSRGEYLLFVDSDMVLTPQVVSEAYESILKNTSDGVIIPEDSIGIGFWAQCKALERSFYVGIDWMEAARFFTKKSFLAMNGYDENNTGTEDYDLPQRMVAAGYQLSRIQSLIHHNEGNLSLIGTMKKKYYYAQRLNAYQSTEANKDSFALQASPLQRYILFFSRPRKIIQQPVLFIGMVIMKTAEFAAGGVGYIYSHVK